MLFRRIATPYKIQLWPVIGPLWTCLEDTGKVQHDALDSLRGMKGTKRIMYIIMRYINVQYHLLIDVKFQWHKFNYVGFKFSCSSFIYWASYDPKTHQENCGILFVFSSFCIYTFKPVCYCFIMQLMVFGNLIRYSLFTADCCHWPGLHLPDMTVTERHNYRFS